ncbi:bacitracin ABC transporter ATP-binding protein, partial [Bacillus paranthracis]|nr:bacitracin ABC transporter ATP-binding protein [Bacillus paranthracis]
KQNRKEFFEEILKEISKIDENRYN